MQQLYPYLYHDLEPFRSFYRKLRSQSGKHHHNSNDAIFFFEIKLTNPWSSASIRYGIITLRYVNAHGDYVGITAGLYLR